MLNLFQLLCILLSLLLRLLRPGGINAVIAENICLRQQLIILTRNKKRCPCILSADRLIFGFFSHYITPKRLYRLAILIKPITLLKLHKALVIKKYRCLFSNKTYKKPGRTSPTQEIIDLVLEYKKRNPRFGYLRIAMQISNQFGIKISNDQVRRILNKFYKPSPSKNHGPSWLTFLGHTKDSLWSVDLFRAESINLKSLWIMVIMDQFTRKIIGFSVHQGYVHGASVCHMFNKIISRLKPPKCISTDNDPIFTFRQWQANLRILEIEEVKSIPYTPISHPFIERLIRTIREDLLNHLLIWNTYDLQKKLDVYQHYFNNNRSHSALDAMTPKDKSNHADKKVISINHYQWKKHLDGLVQLPTAS
jgi:transposase InsO family protein